MERVTADIASECVRIHAARRKSRQHQQRYVNKGGRSINFLGYVFNGASVLLRKSIKTRFAKRHKQATVCQKNEKRAIALRASFKGWCKWGDGKHLYRTLTNENMSFSKSGIKARPNTDGHGKRIFNEKFYPIANIVGTMITILDFEDDIETNPKKQQMQMNESGSDKPRCAVLFQFQTGDNAGQRGKFITSSHEIRDVLLQAREQEKQSGSTLFPCSDCKILTQRIGRYTNYYFEE